VKYNRWGCREHYKNAWYTARCAANVITRFGKSMETILHGSATDDENHGHASMYHHGASETKNNKRQLIIERFSGEEVTKVVSRCK
jgi:hypothetical protein